jgi:hypothetical protein
MGSTKYDCKILHNYRGFEGGDERITSPNPFGGGGQEFLKQGIRN